MKNSLQQQTQGRVKLTTQFYLTLGNRNEKLICLYINILGVPIVNVKEKKQVILLDRGNENKTPRTVGTKLVGRAWEMIK